ncbi:MAG: hypothetical protein HY244_16800, partial [Rhizobiales bacterium]|nr:hypothetical protein [Hyphomicrobiales bacterium]
MKTMHGAAAAAASILTMLLLAPSETANARGGGVHGLHFSAHHHSARHVRHRFPLYGGYLLLPPYDASAAYALPQPFVLVSQPRPCRYDRQVVTVAAEAGGTR